MFGKSFPDIFHLDSSRISSTFPKQPIDKYLKNTANILVPYEITTNNFNTDGEPFIIANKTTEPSRP